MEIIKVEEVVKYFDEQKILENITLTVNKGESIGIVGPNGCGKTTLLKIIYGLLKPDSGRVQVNGKMGYVPQNDLLLPWKKIKENIILSLKLKKVDKKTIEEKLALVSSLFALEDHLEKYPREVSGGTARKTAIARALVNDPEILLLDEPFTGLDIYSVETLINSLKKLKFLGVTIVIVSHQLKELEKIVDKIYYLTYKPAKISEIVVNNNNKR